MINKQLFFFRAISLVLLLFAIGGVKSFATDYPPAFDFSEYAPSGQLLYYKITSETNHTVMVIHPNGYNPSYYGHSEAFHNNPYLNWIKPTGDLVIPEFVRNYKVTAISSYAFGQVNTGSYNSCDGLTSVEIPNSITSIGYAAFAKCSKLNSIIINASVTNIDQRAFYQCNKLQTIYYYGNIEQWCNIEFSDYQSNPVYYANNIFFNDMLITNMVIPNTVKSIKDYSFINFNSLCNVIIPSSVMNLGQGSFEKCSNLYSLTIPHSVTSISYNSFANCSNLTEITSLNPIPPSTTSSSFSNVNKNILVYVPVGSTSAYQSALGWNEFANYVEIVASFSAVSSSGQTIYYAITDLANHYVEVVYPGNSSSAPWEGYDQPTGNLVIPETVDYQGVTYTVKGIGSHAFYGCTDLTQVTIGANVNYVYEKAFWNCPNLETVYFNAEDCNFMHTTYSNTYYSVFSADEIGSSPNITRIVIGNGVQHIPNYAFKNAEDVYQRLVIPASVTDIGDYAFYGCNSMVQMVIQGNGLETIGDYAFYGCSALQTNLNLPNSVVSTGSYAFYGCTHIPSLTIGSGMSKIGDYAFWNCPAMVTVNFNAINCTNMKTQTGSGTNSSPYVYYSVFNNDAETGSVTPITTLNIGPNVTKIPDYAFRNSPNATNQLVFPESLINIGQYAFYNGGFTGEVDVPNSTQTIGQYAFYGCDGITSLTIGEDVESIGSYSFWNCPSLQQVHFNAVNCTSMNTDGSYSVFNSGTSNDGATPISTLTIGPNVTNIPDYAFYNSLNATNTLPLPDGLLNIGERAFYNCSSMTGALLIPNTVTSIGPYAFYHCSGFNGTLTLSNSLNTIKAYTFSGCSGFTGTLSIPWAVSTIAEHAFEDCGSFTGSLLIHNAMTSIGESAFFGCSNISELTLGQGLTSIGGSAFWNCPQMQAVHFNATNCTTMNTSSAYSVFNVGTTSSGATPIVTLTIGENVTRIPDYAFRNSTSATSKIVIPNPTIYIGTYAFFGFRSNELTIGEGVEEIGSYAFWYCPNLQTVHYNAINCTGMKTQTGSGNNTAYYSVFNSGINTVSSPSITLLTIGKKVQNIPDYAFKNCSNANCKLLFPNILTAIGVQSFYEGNSFIGDLVIPNSVTSLGEYAFYNCHGFDGSLMIGSGISSINPYTFADCSGFTGALIIGRSVDSIGSYSFRNCSGFSTLISEHPTPPTASNSSFNNMTYTIPVHVPYAMIPAYQAATGWSLFTNYKEQFVFDQLDNDLWSDTQNWYSFELPSANDVVCVNSSCQLDTEANVLHVYVLNLNDALTINNGQTLTTTYGVGTLQPSQLVIADGGQLVNPVSNAYGTVLRNISGYGSGNEGWFTVSTPIYDGTETNVLCKGTYDLFYYDEPTHYWMNEKMEANQFTSLEPMQGYLYANQTTQTIAFFGQINASNADFSLPVTCDGNVLTGFTLAGNPYTNSISISSLRINNTIPTLYYKAVGGGNLVAYTDADDELIKSGEGFMIQASAEGVLTFNNETRADHKNGYVRLVLSKDGEMLDRAYMCMNNESTLKKVQTTQNVKSLYFKQNEEHFSVVSYDEATVLCFETNEAGTYTIEASLLNTNSKYLHLIDHLTDSDIDLLSTPNYTFIAGNQDDATRFELVLHPGSHADDENRSDRNTYFVMPTHTQGDNQDAYAGASSYTITATAFPSAGGTVSGSGSYLQGVTCMLTATPTTGYTFVNWTENGETVSTNTTYSFTVTGNRALVANFNLNSYAVTVTANPSNGGTVTGANTYNYGSTATLVATANTGYTFVNWTENGNEVSTSATYSFTVTGARTMVANFTETITPTSNHWIPENGSFEDNMTFTAVIQINGEEQHSDQLEVGVFCDGQCRGSQIASLFEPTQRYLVQLTIFGENGDQLTFKLYDHAIEQELNYNSPASVSFNSSGCGSLANPYVLNFTSSITHAQSFTEGWNWWSTYVEMNANNGLAQMENSLGANGLIIKSRNDGYVEPFEYNGTLTWYGTLNGLCNEQSYKINTLNACEASVTGLKADLVNHPITIYSGWNWIGFPSQQSVSVSTALNSFNPEPDDIIKGRNGYASFYSANGYHQWYGTLNSLEPGQGYMYQSNSNETKTLTYNTGREETVRANITPEHNYQKPKSRDFADNMTLTAVVELNGDELFSDNYELAAFVGDECRGSVKLMHVEALNRYIAFLTVFGMQGEELAFRLTDGAETVTAMEKVSFVIDGTVGSLTSPFILHFDKLDVHDALKKPVLVYPNPSKGMFFVEGQGIERIEVYNTLGQCLYTKDCCDSISRVDLQDSAEGMYLLRVITNNGVSNHSIIKK